MFIDRLFRKSCRRGKTTPYCKHDDFNGHLNRGQNFPISVLVMILSEWITIIIMAEFVDTFKENQEKKSRLRLRSDISIRIFFYNVRALSRAINSHFYSHEVLFLNVFPLSLPLQG